jgi:hypothetical protein
MAVIIRRIGNGWLVTRSNHTEGDEAMTRKMQTLDEMFAEEEATRLAKEKAASAAEDAAYHALPQAEKDRIIAEREARWAELDEAERRALLAEDNDEDEEQDQ